MKKLKSRLFGETEMDLTTGNLFVKMLYFALPIMFTTVLQLLYTTVDLLVVSNFGGGANSMSAVGSNGPLINLVVTVFVNLSIGASVAIANYKGAKNPEKAAKILHTSIIISVVFGVVVGIFGAIFSRFLLELLNTPDELIGKATVYLQIYFVGMPFFMLYNYGANILRGLGDSRRPFFILFVAGAFNVVSDYALVRYFGLDVAGVAWATVLSEAISAVLVLWALSSKRNAFIRFRWSELRFDKDSCVEIMRIGLPAGLQGLAFSIPNVIIQSSLYTFTENTVDIVAGNVASGNIEGYVYAVVDAFSVACTAFTSQNYGARLKKNMKKSLWFAVAWDAIFCGALAIVISLFATQLLNMFISQDATTNAEVAIGAGRQRLILLACTYFLDALMDVGSGYLRGMKRSLTPAVIVLIGCTVVRIIFLVTLFRLDYFHTELWLYAVFPISWLITSASMFVAILIAEPKTFAKMKEAQPLAKPLEANASAK